jgi:hypothetical protein
MPAIPRPLRWRGKLKALYHRHDMLVNEMALRGYQHRNPLPKRLAGGSAVQWVLVATRDAQIKILKSERCHCDV